MINIYNEYKIIILIIFYSVEFIKIAFDYHFVNFNSVNYGNLLYTITVKYKIMNIKYIKTSL